MGGLATDQPNLHPPHILYMSTFPYFLSFLGAAPGPAEWSESNRPHRFRCAFITLPALPCPWVAGASKVQGAGAGVFRRLLRELLRAL